MRRSLALALALVAALTLAGCGSKDAAFSGTRLENLWPASQVKLTDTAGSPYSLATDTEDHKLTLVFFGYTHCPDFCPITMNNIAAAFNSLDSSDRADTGMVFITSDPARDTTGVLRRYLDGYNTDFEGLTGSLAAITRVATPFHIYISSGKLCRAAATTSAATPPSSSAWRTARPSCSGSRARPPPSSPPTSTPC